MGRPSEFKQEVADALCEAIAGGMSLRAFCEMDGNPTKTTILRWLRINDAFSAQYARAREEQGHDDADKIGDIAQRTLVGEYDPAAARVAIDALKWSAGKRLPKVYGDKLDVSGNVGLTITLESDADKL